MPDLDSGSDAAVLEDLGSRLRAARLQRNLSQQALAEQAGVGRMTVQRIEEGESTSTTSLVRILRALGALGALRHLLPAPGPGPLEEAERHGRRRQRAGGQRGPAPPEPRQGQWRWGDEGPEDGS